jgi:hypothetical protein
MPIIDFQEQKHFKEAKEQFERDKVIFTENIEGQLLNELITLIKPREKLKIIRMQEFQIPSCDAKYIVSQGSEFYEVSLTINKVER